MLKKLLEALRHLRYLQRRLPPERLTWIRAIEQIHSDRPFNGDMRRAEIVSRLAYNCGYAIETGTWVGNTTDWMAKHFSTVVSIEQGRGFHGVSVLRLGTRDNVQLICGDTAWELPQVLAVRRAGMPFVYLDAHNRQDESPLAAEIKALVRHGKAVVMIDDIKLDGFGSGTYGGQPLDLGYVLSMLPAGTLVFGPNYAPDKLDRGWLLFGLGEGAELLCLNLKLPRLNEH